VGGTSPILLLHLQHPPSREARHAALARHLLLQLGAGVLIGVAAQSVSKLHPRLAPMAHVTRVEGPDAGAGGQQLTLT
jgi:hypothetical protein